MCIRTRHVAVATAGVAGLSGAVTAEATTEASVAAAVATSGRAVAGNVANLTALRDC